MDDKQRLLELLREKKEANRTNKLKFYDPYPFQQEFHNDPETRKALEAGNQIGKCGTIASKVETTKGLKSFRDIFGTECEVLTWPNKEPRKVLGWIRKPKEECFRFTMSDGQWFECPKGHRILTDSGYVFVWQLLDAFPFLIQKGHHNPLMAHKEKHSPLETSLALFRLTRVLDVRRYLRKALDYLDDCFVSLRLCDGRLLYDQDNVQVFAPLQDDAQEHKTFVLRLGDLGTRCTSSLSRGLDRLSSWYDGLQISGLFEISLFRAFLNGAQYKTQNSQSVLQLSGFEYRQQPSDVIHPHQCESLIPSLTPISVNGNKIVSIRSVGVKTLYDMEVEERHNYIAAGMVHHNTVSGCVQDAFDLTGRYPDWYKGKRYNKPVHLVCGGVNNDKTRDLLQKALCGDPVTKDVSLGTGWIPLDCLDKSKISLKRGVSDAYLHVKVKHHTDGVFDGWSTLSFQSYESGKAAWMGDTIDIFHLDEEPPMDILSQAGRGCIATGGSIRCTYTPENGQTDVVLKIKQEWSLHKAGWPDVAGEDFEFKTEDEVIKFRTVYTMNGKPGHITKATVLEAAKLFPSYQMKMRMKGIPVLGSGQVFTYPEEQIKILPLDKIPASWPRGSAIDFGGTSDESHPSAVVFGAYDEVNDILYVYDGFRTYGSEISEVAAKIISRPNSDWIPMFWPHDGGKGKSKNDPAGGTVADKYRRYGVQMFHTHFTNPDDEKGEGKGGIRIEPGITELSGRIFDRRIRVFDTFLEWFEEYRNYHQKDGKIVDKNDDLMAATRYLCQMIRHFVKESDVRTWEDEDEWEDNYHGRNSVSGY